MNKWIGLLILFVVPTVAIASGQPASTDPAPANVAQGQQIYQQYCAACHGQQAEGAANWKKPDEKGEMPALVQDDREGLAAPLQQNRSADHASVRRRSH